MAITDIKVSEIFERNYDSKARITVNRGGTRSGKTYSLQQMHLVRSYEEVKKNTLVTSATWPHLRLTAYKDFLDILDRYDLHDDFRHNKTYHFFENKETESTIHYISSDNEQRVRGQAWDYVQMTEANAMKYDLFRQLILRSPGKFYIDFNPSESNTWINTEIEQKRKDFLLIQSSYRDNPFLRDEVVREIEYLRETDPMYWSIFGLGEYGELKHKIYSNWETISEDEYDNAPALDVFYGIDFGWVHPTVLVQVKYYEGTIYVRELVYESYKEAVDVLLDALQKNNVGYSDSIYCDSADPAKREQIGQRGYNVHLSNKKVNEGIDFLRRFKIKICQSSVNTIREITNYKNKEDKDGKPLPEPVKFGDDAMDAMRYAVFSHLHGRVFF